MLVIDQKTVEQLLPMPKCIELMRGTLSALARGEAVLPLRTILTIPDGAFAVMPAYLASPATIGAKIITVFPKNHGTAFDSHQGAVMLFDSENGSLAAIMDATSVTTIRTAAVSGVATDLLARDDANSLAILGAGVQGHSHLEAMCAVRPLRDVRVWSRNSEHARELADVARARFDLDASVSSSAEEAVRGVDIVCTTTSSTQPLLLGDWLSPGTHLNVVGASQPHAREVDTKAVVRSRLYADRRESALKEPGDIIVPLQEGAITPDHIVGEIGEILIGRAPGRRNREDITLFKSLGLAIEDLSSASHVYAEARRLGVGVDVDLGGVRSAAH
jgi:ornithine cyclodeaminase